MVTGSKCGSGLLSDRGQIRDLACNLHARFAVQFACDAGHGPAAPSLRQQYGRPAYFHSWNLGLNIIRPSVGLNFSANNANHYEGQVLTGSNGYVLSGVAGINFQRGKIGVAANGYLPIAQDLYDGQTHFQSRGSLTLMLLF